MEDIESMRLTRAAAVARRVMELSPTDRLVALTFLAGMVPLSVEKALAYVREGIK